MLTSSLSIPTRAGPHYGSAEEFRRCVAHQYCDHDLRLSEPFEPSGGEFFSFRLPRMSIHILSYGAEAVIDAGDFKDFFMVEAPLNGGVEIQYGDETLRTDRQRGAVLAPGRHVRSRWSADCRQVMLRIDRAAFEEQLCRELGRGMRGPLLFKPSLDLDSSVGRSLARIVTTLYEGLAEPDGPTQQPPVVSQMENLILTTLLYGQPHSYSGQLHGQPSPVLPRHVRRALNEIQANPAIPFNAESLADRVGVSRRTLYAGFREFLGTSPKAYHLAYRLDRVREDLLALDVHRRVGDVAANWGFQHLGRFAEQYRLRFGELPSDTVRGLRDPATVRPVLTLS